MSTPSVDIRPPEGKEFRGVVRAFDEPRPKLDLPVVDCAVHVQPSSDAQLREYMDPAWRDRRLPSGERYYHPNPVGDYCADTWPPHGPPGSDRELVTRQLLDIAGVRDAVLLPKTRGIMPDIDFAAEICTATNRWQHERWLTSGDRAEQFWGTIRVCPDDPQAAALEIKRWAAQPAFVQVGIPLQSLQPYGRRVYLPVWEAAAQHGLPVVIHADAASGVEPFTTPAGYQTYFAEYAAYLSLNFTFHFQSLLAEGVFERFPDLVVVFADGGQDVLAPLLWRWEKDYLPTRNQMPWMRTGPSGYLSHFRFVTQRYEGPEEPSLSREWADMSHTAAVGLYGGNYPEWDYLDPRVALAGLDDEVRWQVFVGNPQSLYRLDERRAERTDRRGGV